MMEIINTAGIDTGRMEGLAEDYDTEGLRVRITTTRKGARTPYSGVCYYTKGRIRVSVNPLNRYPLRVRVGSPFNRDSWRYFSMESVEDLSCFIFLHELSHYLDYQSGIPVRCKQTKADLFALRMMGLI